MKSNKIKMNIYSGILGLALITTTAVHAATYPTSFKAQAINHKTVRLTWTKGASATGYSIMRRSGAGDWQSIASVGNVSTYDDTTATGGQTYAYKVKGYPYEPEDGSQGNSNDDFEQTPTGAATGLMARALTTRQIQLNWYDNSVSETGFDIERKLECGTFAKIGSVGANVKTYTDTTIQTATRYTYRVKPVGVSSLSPYSNEVDEGAPLSAPPTPSVSATFYSTSVSLSWSDTDNNYSNDEDAFLVQRKSGAETIYTTIATLKADTTVYSDKTVLPQSTYSYMVVATNIIGATGSSVKTGTTPAADSYDGSSKDDNKSTATSLPSISLAVRTNSGHSLSTADSNDWFKATLTAGKKYEFYTKAGTGSGGNGNTYGELYNSSSVRVASDDNSGGSYQFKLSYTPSASGTYSLRVKAASGASLLANYMLCYREVLKPTVTIVATDDDADEWTLDTGKFTVSRASGSDISASLTVYYSTSGSTASSVDYNTLSGYVTIPANSYSATITVTPKNNTMPEETETVKLTLTSSSAYTVGSPSTATVYIYDDDYVEDPWDEYPYP